MMSKDQAGTHPLEPESPPVGGITRCEMRVMHFGLSLLTRGFWQRLAAMEAVFL